MSGIIGLAGSKSGTLPEIVTGYTSTPNSGAFTHASYGPTSLNFNWIYQDGVVVLNAYFVVTITDTLPTYVCLPYKSIGNTAAHITSTNTDIDQYQRVDAGSRTLRWNTGATGGPWGYYVNIVYLTDGTI